MVFFCSHVLNIVATIHIDVVIFTTSNIIVIPIKEFCELRHY